MKLRIVALGHRMPAWVDAGFNDYARRMPRDLRVELTALKPESRSQGKSAAALLAAEARHIGAACKDARVIALDEHGKSWTTRELASRLEAWRADARDVAFVIGSADGLDASVKHGAAHTVALSALTLPHGLVRVLLAEQLYRAVSLLSAHPYHRD